MIFCVFLKRCPISTIVEDESLPDSDTVGLIICILCLFYLAPYYFIKAIMAVAASDPLKEVS